MSTGFATTLLYSRVNFSLLIVSIGTGSIADRTKSPGLLHSLPRIRAAIVYLVWSLCLFLIANNKEISFPSRKVCFTFANYARNPFFSSWRNYTTHIGVRTGTACTIPTLIISTSIPRLCQSIYVGFNKNINIYHYFHIIL